MENKKASFILVTLVFIILLTLLIIVFYSFYLDFKEYRTYKEFCINKPDFCYCSWDTCEFKTQWSSNEGMSNDTKELCELSRKLNDKKMLFKAGCLK